MFSAVGRLSPDFIVQDGVVPRGRLAEALREIESISSRSGIPVANVFHAGDGNLHPLILYDGRIRVHCIAPKSSLRRSFAYAFVSVARLRENMAWGWKRKNSWGKCLMLQVW